MKDASSENGGGFLPVAESSSPQTQNEAGRAPAGSLTELAQLLAASIAQTQASKGRGGMPTNADLTSLANLVSAASNNRTPSPVFKDGLSSLSYAAPRPGYPQGPAAQHPNELAHDDEPMPIPSTWRQPALHDEDGWLRQQMGAAFVGLLAGLAIVVPTVLWLSGVFDASKTKSAATTRTQSLPADSKVAAAPEVRTVKVQVRPVERSDPAPQQAAAAQYVAGNVEPKPAAPVPVVQPIPPPVTADQPAATASVATAARLVEPKSPVDELLAKARQHVEKGDISGARELLAGADEGSGAAVFALAETYDPNMLAAWGTRGVAADVARARALYRKAQGLGAERAQARLDALK